MIALLTGCGPVHRLATSGAAKATPTSRPTAIAWLPLPPGPVGVLTYPSPSPPPPVQPGTKGCDAGQLVMYFAGFNGALGHEDGTVGLRNLGAEDCYLQGEPDIWLLNPAGQQIAMQQRESPSSGWGEKGAAVLLAKWKQTEALFEFEIASAPICSDRPADAAAIALTLGSGTLTASIDRPASVYACAGLELWDFYPSPPALEPIATAALPQPHMAYVPRTVRRGATLDYRVALSAAAGFDFVGDCPSYVEALNDPDGVPLVGKLFYGLNCAAAGVLRPGETLYFDMRLPVPTNAPLGTYRLFWGYMGPSGEFAEDTLTVTS